MPQMAPLNWLTLSLFFIMIFFSFLIINYFNYTINSSNNSPPKKMPIKINWKW